MHAVTLWTVPHFSPKFAFSMDVLPTPPSPFLHHADGFPLVNYKPPENNSGLSPIEMYIQLMEASLRPSGMANSTPKPVFCDPPLF
jgi:hypothetical protein